MIFLKFCACFAISFLILSIPATGNKTFFQYIYNRVEPHAENTYDVVSDKMSWGWRKSKRVAKKFFNTTAPELETEYNTDEVSSRKSAPRKPFIREVPEEVQAEINSDQQDEYTVEERQLLERVLESSDSEE